MTTGRGEEDYEKTEKWNQDGFIAVDVHDFRVAGESTRGRK